MSQEKIAARYAKSLIDIATSQNNLDEVYQDILGISEVCKNREFASMLKSPIITSDKKNQIFEALFGSKVNKITHQFIALLTIKGRESGLTSICNAFIKQYKVLKKIRSARVVTANEMNNLQLDELKQRFSHWLTEGDRMELEQVVNPALIGGFIMSMDDKQYDCSVKRQLEEMKENLYDTSYINLVEKN
jgi:F-type H+-transporting ATPase subunit delta